MDIRSCILTMAFLLLAILPAEAGRRVRPPMELRRHEFALSGAFYPGRYSIGYDYETGGMKYDRLFDGGGIHDIYEKAGIFSEELITNSWTFSYTYNFTKILAVSASMSYEGGWYREFSREDRSRIFSVSNHYISPLVGFRASWLNRSFVRMYSSLALGVSLKLADDASVIFAGQFTPLGISFGRKLYGFVEMGYGSVYAGGCAGIGYRF